MKKETTQEIKDFCKEIGITEDQFHGKELVKGSLWLDEVERIPEGFNPKVEDGIWLNKLTSIPEDFSPVVGGTLYLDGLTSLSKGFNPVVGGSLWLGGLTSIPEGFNPTVGGSLWLSGLTSIPEGFSPVVGDNLWLDGLTSIPEGFNPIVGGSLGLEGLTSIPEGFSPTVGGNLGIAGRTKLIRSKIDDSQLPRVFTWENGKYIKADGIFTEVVSKRGNVYRVRKIGEEAIFYLVTDGNGNWSHGSTLKEAKEDLIFKITNHSTDEYKSLTLESELTFEEGIEAYRVITGACSLGARDFVKNRLKGRKKKYKVSEIISVTQGEYGNRAFESFFSYR